MALLVTGRTLDEMRGEEFEVAREQVLSYLTGRVGSQLGRGIERATGLSDVRIEPQLIANEADPSARLTVGQELTDDLKLVYSTSLTDSNDQIWIAEYDVTRRFQTRAVRQSDNSYRLDFRHDVRFGGARSPAAFRGSVRRSLRWPSPARTSSAKPSCAGCWASRKANRTTSSRRETASSGSRSICEKAAGCSRAWMQREGDERQWTSRFR